MTFEINHEVAEDDFAEELLDEALDRGVSLTCTLGACA